MYQENERYTKLNQLAIENADQGHKQRMLVHDGSIVRSIPAI